MRILRDYDIREQLPSIAAPVLYLAADRDTLVPSVEQARLMSERTPRRRCAFSKGMDTAA